MKKFTSVAELLPRKRKITITIMENDTKVVGRVESGVDDSVSVFIGNKLWKFEEGKRTRNRENKMDQGKRTDREKIGYQGKILKNKENYLGKEEGGQETFPCQFCSTSISWSTFISSSVSFFHICNQYLCVSSTVTAEHMRVCGGTVHFCNRR